MRRCLHGSRRGLGTTQEASGMATTETRAEVLMPSARSTAAKARMKKDAEQRSKKAQRGLESLEARERCHPASSHPTARRGEQHVGDLSESLNQSQPAVSHHPALMRHGGIVVPRRQGKNRLLQPHGFGRNSRQGCPGDDLLNEVMCEFLSFSRETEEPGEAVRALARCCGTRAAGLEAGSPRSKAERCRTAGIAGSPRRENLIS